MSWQSRVALRCASIICAIPNKALNRVSQSLLDEDGEDQFRLLVERFYDLDAETRAAVVSRMQPAPRRLIRVVRGGGGRPNARDAAEPTVRDGNLVPAAAARP